MERIIAKELLRINAVFLKPNDPFTWASGIKSPIYCDNRLTLSYPKVRKIIELGLSNIIRNKFPTCEYIMGTATAGIAHAAYVSDILNLPMGYVRSSTKSHGRTNQIEGLIQKGKNVVVIEDLISTGGSSVRVVETLREVGFNVLGIVAIFTYNLKKGFEVFNNHNVEHYSLSNYDELLEAAMEENYIEESDLAKLKQWKSDPSDETWINK